MVDNGRTPRGSHAVVPADARFLGTWHHAQGEFNLPNVGMMPGYGKPEFSPPTPHLAP